MEKIYIGLFVVELIKYWILFYTIFEVKIKNIQYSIVAFMIYTLLIVITDISWIEASSLMYFLVVILQFFTVDLEKKSRLLKIMSIFFIVAFLDELVDASVDFILIILYGNTLKEDIIINSIISIAFVGIIFLLKKKRNIFVIDIVINYVEKKTEIILFLIGIEIIMIITTLNVIKDYINNEVFQKYASCLSILSFLCVGALAIIIISIKDANKKMKRLVEIERKLKKMQEDYYISLLEKEKETKQYRHDMSNHLIYLMELAYEEQAKQVVSYIKKLQENLVYIQKKSYITGNSIVDVVLNYYMNMISESVEKWVEGSWSKKIEIDDVDLCIVFSNLLQNAVEALEGIKQDRKYLFVNLSQGKAYAKAEIINSMDKPVKRNNKGTIITTKDDKNNHGIGLISIEQIVKKNKGIFEIETTDQEFKCTVILSIKDSSY